MSDDIGIGHNSRAAALGELKGIVKRIEEAQADRDDYVNTIKELYVEAKSRGFNTKVLRKLLRLRQQDQDKLREEEETLESYRSELGE